MIHTLELTDVVKRYGLQDAVNGLSFQVTPGEIYGLIGGNGAGKTTTMRMILGLFYPDEGAILYGNQPFSSVLKNRIGYLPEERGLYPKVKVCDQIIYLAKLRGMRTQQAELSLRMWLDRFQVIAYYDKRVEELSKGNQQKIQFISAVVHNPDYLILDEVFSGLDPVNVEMMKKAILSLRDAGKTILFSSHRMDHVEELCKKVSILHRSHPIAQGTLKDIKRSFPCDRIWLVTESPVDGIESIQGVTQVITKENGLEIFINDTSVAQEIAQLAWRQSTVYHFELKQPSLNEIFIQLVGGEHTHA